jgi:diguanylate cyclase (GGDEF)-like protein
MNALVADDDRGAIAILSKAIRGLGLDLTVAHTGTAAWEHLTSGAAPGLVIMDWMMPGLDGPEICRRIRQHPALRATYVILLTSRDHRADVITGLDAGADDYIVKPFDLEELRARVHVGQRVARLQQQLAHQIDELRAARDELARAVSTDALTGLASRRSWFDTAATELQRARRHQRPLGLLLADLDHFKRVNDTFGHDTGDRVLKAFANVLRQECRRSDVVGRLGGEEFALLLPETTLATAREAAARIVNRCRGLLVPSPSGPVCCTCSIGVTEAAPDEQGVEAMLARADQALYAAKHNGRDTFQ